MASYSKSNIDYFNLTDLFKIFKIGYQLEIKNSTDLLGNYWIILYFENNSIMNITFKQYEGSVLLYDLYTETNGSTFYGGDVSTEISIRKMLEDAYNNMNIK